MSGQSFAGMITEVILSALEAQTTEGPPEDRFTIEDGDRAGITAFILTHRNGDVVHVVIQESDDSILA